MDPITFSDLAAFIGVIAVIGVASREIYKKVDANRTALLNKLTEESKELHGRISHLRDELAEHKLYVAHNHVSFDKLRETEDRLVTAMDKLGNRIETVVGKIDGVRNEVAQVRMGQ